MAFSGVSLIRKTYSPEQFLTEIDIPAPRILNAGSSSVRFGGDCVNVDVQEKPNVDVVADIHALPPDIGLFDVVVANAVLQYCRSPEGVAAEFLRVLKPGGFIYVDAPWIQPYCPDTADLKRFSKEELLRIFADFDVLSCGPSITSGSALAYLGQSVAGGLTHSRNVNAGARIACSVLLWPLTFINANPDQTAGAFYLTGRKPAA